MDERYVAWTPDVEQWEPDEEAVVERVVAAMARANKLVFDKHRHATRDAHAKSHGVLRAELRVLPGLPEHLRQGMFAQPTTYDAIVRLSSDHGDLRSDQLQTHRGMAIKVLGVEGPRVMVDDGHSQDFLLVNRATLPFGTVHDYAKLQLILENQPRKSDALMRAQGLAARSLAAALTRAGREVPAAVQTQVAPHVHLLGETYHSMAAIGFGAHLAKISAAPASASVRALTGRPIDRWGGPSVLRDDVVRFFRDHDADYDLRAQLCTDLQAMPVEDASVLWDEERSPHQPVAVLHVPAQEAYSDDRRRYVDDVLSFDPWHAIEAHRPLGGIMRSRKRAYEVSRDFRYAANGVQPREPSTIDELPD